MSLETGILSFEGETATLEFRKKVMEDEIYGFGCLLNFEGQCITSKGGAVHKYEEMCKYPRGNFPPKRRDVITS